MLLLLVIRIGIVVNFTKGFFRVKENYILTPTSNSVARSCVVEKKEEEKKEIAGVAEDPMSGKLHWELFISCSS